MLVSKAAILPALPSFIWPASLSPASISFWQIVSITLSTTWRAGACASPWTQVPRPYKWRIWRAQIRAQKIAASLFQWFDIPSTCAASLGVKPL